MGSLLRLEMIRIRFERILIQCNCLPHFNLNFDTDTNLFKYNNTIGYEYKSDRFAFSIILYLVKKICY
jgi:hypothetical protein